MIKTVVKFNWGGFKIFGRILLWAFRFIGIDILDSVRAPSHFQHNKCKLELSELEIPRYPVAYVFSFLVDGGKEKDG
jgi:hypothetical protein